MSSFRFYEPAEVDDIRAVVEREVGRDLKDDEGLEALLGAISGLAIAFQVESPGAKASGELEKAQAKARALKAALHGAEESMALGFMLHDNNEDFSRNYEDARLQVNDWLSGLDSIISGFEHELAFRRGRSNKGRPSLVKRNVFWASLKLLWIRDIGGAGPGKVADEWCGGIIDFIAACSRPFMDKNEITAGKIGEFLKSEKRSPTLPWAGIN